EAPAEPRPLPDAPPSVPRSQGRNQGVVRYRTASGKVVEDVAHRIVERLGNRDWGGSYFTFSTENNETIWTFLKKCFARGKVYRGHDVMPWSGLAGSAYSQMEVADGRRLTTHRSVFVRLPIVGKGGQESGERSQEAARREGGAPAEPLSQSERGGRTPLPGERGRGEGSDRAHVAPSASRTTAQAAEGAAGEPLTPSPSPQGEGDRSAASLTTHHSPHTTNEYLLVWTTTPWTLTSNVAAAVNPDLDYVRLRAKRDGAIYYFAKDNLEFKRLEREFKEGFGRPEWGWPEGVPKLKTLAQIFKEQGGYEILGTVKGAEMIGWRYVGPFDDLPAQQVKGGVPEDKTTPLAGVDCHRVIDGGRDTKGNPNVTAGEGTGIVHIAPGCGDIDHKLGEEHGIVSIAPLAADGTFVDGFGEFTGLKATSPEVPELVLRRLREKGFHVADEVYPHIYPFCWRTGDELVFRLVDEWFVDMSWREEIKDVVRAIRWLPPSIQGEERELEWLTTMRDWMISKKRFWGLALPIWVDEQTGDFEVIGSLAELKERAVDGWDEFEGNTPHRPWIDRVKIRNPKTGNRMSRVPDVGNPWLDAGIVAFSTMSYRQDRDHWRRWYPADLVLECFPGQFRNWFYSLLAMSTMMRHGETDDPAAKRPFKALFGHRLVMNEEGKPMHKSDGTAIWFEEAAEQLGVDTLRWMYLSQNPAADLRFGTRHPDQPVTLRTPEGEVGETKEGFRTCLVTSKPADEVRRQVLIPLWNSYAFFVNYARLDGFDPTAPQVPYEERPEIDRWILSNLQALIETSEKAWPNCDAATACAAAASFIDDLSNWYIRRNRRRFWRGKSEGDRDKLAAYQTLYEVLVTLTKLLAPAIPFLSERMYQNLVRG
ncbi:MAG TPA: class I tRNA ligase family protein, partial [Planctomycetaceae bacterium]